MVLVKICGITNLGDALIAMEAGADMLGFMCYAKSARFIEPEMIRAVVRSVRTEAASAARTAPARPASQSGTRAGARTATPPVTGRVPRFVGVFVNAPVADVRHIVERCGLDYAQLHGDEPVDDLLALGGRGFKALRLSAATRAFTDAQLYVPLAGTSGPQLLVDAFTPGAYGGTGQRADWDLAARLAADTPRLLLAGGLTPENVADAVRTVRPWGVDVSSGVEIEPGRKDADKLRRFIQTAKAA